MDPPTSAASESIATAPPGSQPAVEMHPESSQPLINVPPKAIFDPPEVFEDTESIDDYYDHHHHLQTPSFEEDYSLGDHTLSTREDTVSTSYTGGTRSTRHFRQRRLQRKHPSQLNEVELRVQLWDSYRLARIILGTPIRSFSLKGKTILHSIRKVAEMKLELIRLQKELEMAQVVMMTQSQNLLTNAQDTSPNKMNSKTKSAPLFENGKRKQASSSKQRSQLNKYEKPHLVEESDSVDDTNDLSLKLNLQIAQIVAPGPGHPPPSSLSGATTPAKSNVREVSISSVETNPHENMSPLHAEENVEGISRQMNFEEPQATDGKSMSGDADPTPKRKTKKLTAEQRLEVYQSQYHSLQQTHNQMIQDFQSQLQAMQSQVEAVHGVEDLTDQAQSKEEHKQALHSPQSNNPLDRKIASSASNLMTLEEENLAERHRLQLSIEQLLKKVDETSEKSQHQYNALQSQLHGIKSVSYDSDISAGGGAHQTQLLESHALPEGEELSAHLAQQAQGHATKGKIQTQEQFDQRLRTIQTLHTLELESFKSKHFQQVVDMSGQLDAYQQQVEKQNAELQKSRKKYNHLEEMAVTPSEAKNILNQLESLNPDSTKEEHQEVHNNAMLVLQRMVQLQSKQSYERKSLQINKDAALERAAKSQEELDFLNLQRELLEEDTKISTDEWKDQLSQQRKTYRREISNILREEEHRLIEMEYLEVHLTELAYLAVEIEDLEAEHTENHQGMTENIAKASKNSKSTETFLTKLRAKVQQVCVKQKKRLSALQDELSDSNTTENLEERLSNLVKKQGLEASLLQKDCELQETKSELLASQERIAALEAQLAASPQTNEDLPRKVSQGLSMGHLGFTPNTTVQ